MRILLINAGYFVKESVGSLLRSPFLNLVSIISIGLSLLLLALLFAGWWGSEEITARIKEDAEMAVFYQEGLEEAELSFLEESLKETQGVREITHVDEEEAYTRMEDILGEGAEILKSLEDNPFDPFFSISADPEIIPALAGEIGDMQGVDYVRDNEEIISQFTAISEAIRYVGIVLLAIVGVSTMIITSHIIRLGIMSKEAHINLLRLLGADKSFIYLPFLLEGVLLGGLGGLFALALLLVLLPYVFHLASGLVYFLPTLPTGEILLPLGIMVLLLGVVFSLFGSILALRFTGRERV